MTTVPVITTERLTLRAPGPQDLEPMVAFYASDRSRFVGGPMTREGTWRALATEIGHWAMRGYGRWIVELTETGEPVGIVGLWNPHGWPEPEVGWDLFNGHEGKGYATEAARAARGFAYDTLGWTTLISLVKTGNDGSAAVATRLGAVHEGTFDHERWGALNVYRHPAPQECA